jgi:TATA-box binding protein (TBP) (component of TFIID and TFIIIB)
MSRINFNRILDNTVPLEQNSPKSLSVNNIVSTVQLLNANESICLESLALNLSGLIKYAPKKFAAAIMRLKDGISTTTCLVFRSAKIVVVGAVTYYHSLMACQRYRLLIESVEGVYRGETGLSVYNLTNRMQFINWRITNIVASVRLQCRPDLKILTEIAADLSAWNPELFPGMKLLVWLRPKDECKCVKKKKNKSCDCNCRALIFDTGEAIITGCNTIQDLNLSHHRIVTLLSDDELHDKDAEPSKRRRFESRREKIIKAAYVEFAGWNNRSKAVTNEEEDLIEQLLRMHVKPEPRWTEEDVDLLTPLERARKFCQKNNVEFIEAVERRC